MLSLCARLYALLLVAYPAGFRRAYGLRMAHEFRACCRDGDRRPGRGLLGCEGSRLAISF